MPALQSAVTSVHKGTFVQLLDADTSGFQAQRTQVWLLLTFCLYHLVGGGAFISFNHLAQERLAE